MTEQPKLAFIDVETTGLNPLVHKLWSIAIITEGKEFYAQFPVVLDEHTDLEALEVNNYVSVMANSGQSTHNNAWITHSGKVKTLLKDKTLVGAAVHFDAAFIDSYLRDAWYTRRQQGFRAVGNNIIPPMPPWHYKLLDVCTLTMGTLGLDHIPKLSECCELWNIPVDDSQKHNALYDTQLAQLVYQRCMNKHYGPAREEGH